MLRPMPKTRWPMDTRPILPYMTIEDISSKYDIPLSTLYKYQREISGGFPAPYKRMTNKLRKLAFETYRIEFWYKNCYLKYHISNSAKCTRKVVDDLLKD